MMMGWDNWDKQGQSRTMSQVARLPELGQTRTMSLDIVPLVPVQSGEV